MFTDQRGKLFYFNGIAFLKYIKRSDVGNGWSTDIGAHIETHATWGNPA